MRLSIDQWRELARPYYDVIPQRPTAEAGVEIEARQACSLLLTQLEAPAQMLVHDPESRKSVDHDYLLFERFYQGGGAGEVADIVFAVRPSRLHLIDMSRRYVSRKIDSTSRGVLIPHGVIGFQRGVDPTFATVDIASPGGRLLIAAHDVLVATNQTAEEVSEIALAFVDLVRRFMLRRACATFVVDDNRLTGRLLREYIQANLDKPDLDSDRLIATFGISRATLYRHFREDGGVSRFIQNRRLDRCFFEFAGSPQTRGLISRVAKRWCFQDAPSFNRSFQKRFSVAPSDCLVNATEASEAAPTALMRLSQAWFQQLGGA